METGTLKSWPGNSRTDVKGIAEPAASLESHKDPQRKWWGAGIFPMHMQICVSGSFLPCQNHILTEYREEEGSERQYKFLSSVSKLYP